MVMRVIVTAVIVADVVMRPVRVQGNRNPVGLACTSALQFAKRAAFGKPLHMVVMALLSASNVLLETKHLSPVFTQRTIHGCVAANDLFNPLTERLHNLGVITQVVSGQKFNGGMILSHAVCVLSDPTDQHP